MVSRALAWLLLLVAAPAAAQTFPPFSGFVVDAANVLPPAVEADLSAKLDALQRDTKRQLIVATIPDMQGYPLEEYGYKLGRTWGVGLRDVDNGIVLFIAPNEPVGHRGPRIEVGRGLEPIVTDALAHQIIFDQMMPRLTEAHDVPGAMTAGTDALIALLRAAPEEVKARADAAAAAFDRERRAARQGDGEGGVPITLIFWGVVLLFFIVPAIFGRRRGRRWSGGGGNNWPIVLWSVANDLGRGSSGGWRSGGWGGSSGGGGSSWGGGGFTGGGGGFTGGGGGSFGGGGASGSW